MENKAAKTNEARGYGWANLCFEEYEKVKDHKTRFKTVPIPIGNSRAQTPFKSGIKILLIEQNPDARRRDGRLTEWAYLKRTGKNVVQIAVDPENNPDGGNSKYFGVYVDGVFCRYSDGDTQRLAGDVRRKMRKATEAAQTKNEEQKRGQSMIL